VSIRGPGRPPGTTHDEIRDIALGLFLVRGYAKTSLASIAHAAGISRTTLFSYFPSKRELIWEEHDQRAAEIETAMDDGPARPVVDMIVRGLLVSARYGVDEHAVLAARLRVVEQDDELRAFAALAVKDTTKRVSEGAARRAPNADPRLIDLVTRALVAAASQCTEEWASQEQPTSNLDVHTSHGIRVIVDALRPLLP